MEQLEKTKQQLDDNTQAIVESGRKLVEAAREANKGMADVSGKFRDGANKLGVAIDGMMKVAGRSDFAEAVRLTESFVASMERLAALEEKGILEKVMRAMKND